MSTMDKVKNVLHMNKDKDNTSGTSEGMAGPHSSRTANAADPRVDSDMDNSRTTGYGNTTGDYSNTTGTTGDYSNTTGGTGDYSNTTGTTGDYSNTTGTSGSTGYGDNSTGYNTSSNAGPHDSNMMNKADPRVDSDMDGSRTTGGYGNTSSDNYNGNTTNDNFSSGNTSSGYGNTSSDNYSSGNTSGDYGNTTTGDSYNSTPGSGKAQNTAGPHNSDMMNKLDPRVDSDMDNSKTFGGDKTMTGTRDPRDASQVPPSVFAQHAGEPTITHGDIAHDRAGRHGSLSHQETHSGI